MSVEASGRWTLALPKATSLEGASREPTDCGGLFGRVSEEGEEASCVLTPASRPGERRVPPWPGDVDELGPTAAARVSNVDELAVVEPGALRS